MNDDFKPNLLLLHTLAQQDITFINPNNTKVMSVEDLEKAEEYYTKILEGLAGKQVWQIIECLSAIEHNLLENRRGMLKYLDASTKHRT